MGANGFLSPSTLFLPCPLSASWNVHIEVQGPTLLLYHSSTEDSLTHIQAGFFFRSLETGTCVRETWLFDASASSLQYVRSCRVRPRGVALKLQSLLTTGLELSQAMPSLSSSLVFP